MYVPSACVAISVLSHINYPGGNVNHQLAKQRIEPFRGSWGSLESSVNCDIKNAPVAQPHFPPMLIRVSVNVKHRLTYRIISTASSTINFEQFCKAHDLKLKKPRRRRSHKQHCSVPYDAYEVQHAQFRACGATSTPTSCKFDFPLI